MSDTSISDTPVGDLSEHLGTYSKSLLDELREVDETVVQLESGDEPAAMVTQYQLYPPQEHPYIDYSVCSPIDTSFSDVVVDNTNSNTNSPVPPVPEPISTINGTILTDVDDNYSCLICKDLLCEPVVLLCQHAYCYECLKDFHKTKTKQLTDYWEPVPVGGTDAGNRCPCCKFPFTVPPKYNHEYEQAIEKIYPDQYQQRKSEVRLKEKKDKLVEQMRKEVWNMISERPPTAHDMAYGGLRDMIRPGPFTVGRRFVGSDVVTSPVDDIYEDIPFRSIEEQKQDRKLVSTIWSWTKFVITNPLVLTMGAVYLTKRMGMI